MWVIVGVCCVVVAARSLPSTVHAVDPIEELEQQKDELEHLLQLSADATAPLEKEMQAIEARITKALKDVKAAETQNAQLAEQIAQEEDTIREVYAVLTARVDEQYRRSRVLSPLIMLLSAPDAARLTQVLTYRRVLQAWDTERLNDSSQAIASFQERKHDIEERRKKILVLKTELDRQAEFFRKEIKGAKAYQQELSSKIAALSAKQQDIINARSGAFTTSVGDVPLADDFNASIGFKAQAPSNSFAVFSFGAFTHRQGMSQYGAKARAESGQNVEEILRAYYPGAQLKKEYGVPGSITVQGVGTIAFEDTYMKGISEMPKSWHIEAQKAQAVAARSFALAYIRSGKSICTTEACQVYRSGNRGGDWERAVNDTRGWVLVDGSGQPYSAKYASTHGGYTTTSQWDTTDKNGGGDWSTRAWESKAKSPWFYKAWYTQAYSVNSAKCGRSHPWLSQDEFSDIINAWIVRRNPGGADLNRIQPTTINECHVGGSGGNPYSRDELRDWANKSGGAVTNISSVSVSHSGAAQTTTVTLQTNRGQLQIPGDEFKSTFNVRAPGYLSIPQKNFAFF
jgi:peptidoglycan hydrolase-like amidase